MSDTEITVQLDPVDPTKDVRRWLRAMLIDMINHPSEHSGDALKVAIVALTDIAEPALLHEMFATWIEIYKRLMDEYQNKKSTAAPDSSSVDWEESPAES